MLDNYEKSYKKNTNQILIISKDGVVFDSESAIFHNIKNKHINTLHPFFQTIFSLLQNHDEIYTFNCVNIEVNDKAYTIDIKLYTNAEKENAVFVFNDLTKQYKTFQKVSQLGNEAAIKSQLLDYQNVLIQQKEAFRDRFITNFSHELRLPINTIAGFSSLLENTNLQQEQRYNLNVIKSTNHKLMNMLNDILEISKIQTGHFSIYESEYNLLHELQLIKDIYTLKCKEKGLELVVDIDKGCPEVVVSDKYRMAQIASNLIGNAIKFTNSGSITLAVKPKEKKTNDNVTLEFTVKDTGVGIPKEKQKHIFKSFYQIENNITNNGSGLGLAITKNLIEALDGKISINSEVNKGTTIKVLLDYKISHNKIPNKIIAKNSRTTKHLEHKVLVAEPLAKDKITIIEILSKKYDVTIVETGDDVIEELHKQSFDVVIINLKLPTMDGLDTIRYIRFSKIPKFSKIPIIVVSANPSSEEEKMCKQKHINSYLGKPYDKQEVLRKVKYLIQKKQAK